MGPNFAPASCPETDARPARVGPLRRPVSLFRRSWVFKRPGLDREQGPGPCSFYGDKHPDRGTDVSIMATGLWEAKTQTEEGAGASGTFSDYHRISRGICRAYELRIVLHISMFRGQIIR